MEQRHLQATVATAFTAILLIGCGGIGKMNKYVENVKYTVDPNPLIVQGDSVDLNLRGNFPGKYFYKKASVDLTPTLVYAGGETPYKMVCFQGEKAASNCTVIPYETGKDFTYSNKIAYQPAMEVSELKVRILGKQGKKEKAFDDVKIADGVITTPYLMVNDDKVITGADAFQRTTSHSTSAQLNYLVASSNVRPGELSDADIKAMSAWVKSIAKNERIVIKSAVMDAWASPEGELDMNANLADDRAASGKAWVKQTLNANKIAAGKNDSLYVLNANGEDWEGFKKATEASNFADKDLVLRVMQMEPDVQKRESQIKDMAATYKEIAEDILPGLRRTEIVVNYDKVGYSDEELTTMSRTMPDSLNVEELLYAATLTSDMNEKLRIYKECERVHPSDWRGANNVGTIHFMQNRMAEAEASFQKANSTTDNPVSTNNLAVIARQKGDRKKAMEMLKKSGAAGPDVKYNMGLIDIQNGNYGSASTNFGSTNSMNAALAKVLGGDAAGAQRILEAAPDKDSATSHYLMAILGARQNNGDMVRNHLAQAVAKNPDYAAKAKNDLEFRAFKDNLGI